MDKKLLWLDLETTGLVPADDNILSLGLIVTDGMLNELAIFEYDVRQTGGKGALAPYAWGQVVREMHEKSGLTARLAKAPFTLDEVRTLARAFILEHAGEKPFLAGSTVHFDHRMLLQHAPEIPALCHYRMLDVSVFKVLGKMWGIPEWESPLKGEAKHTPLADIRDSIATLKWYCNNALAECLRDNTNALVGVGARVPVFSEPVVAP